MINYRTEKDILIVSPDLKKVLIRWIFVMYSGIKIETEKSCKNNSYIVARSFAKHKTPLANENYISSHDDIQLILG